MKPSEWLARRFWKHVDRSDSFGCWLWTGAISAQSGGHGYGSLTIDGRRYQAHRIAWNITYGTTRGMFVLHKCDVKECVNPHHLHLGTGWMNSQDAFARGRKLRFEPDVDGEFYDDYEPISLRDLFLDEDIRSEISERAMLTAQRKRFDNARMLSDRNMESVTESNEWINVEGCDFEMEGYKWGER